MSTTSSILYQNASKTITILDIPRSIEEAQKSDTTSSRRRLISSKPLQKPYSSLEPKSTKALRNSPQVTIQELFLTRHLQLVLDEIRDVGITKFCLPRATNDTDAEESRVSKRKLKDVQVDIPLSDSLSSTAENETLDKLVMNEEDILVSYTNPATGSVYYIPPRSTFLTGFIESTCAVFRERAPKFDVVVMDPPWPNRSVSRSKSYETAYSEADMTHLLYKIPLVDHLADDALVGIWITNKAAIRNLVTDPGGILDHWNLELMEEWIWLKVTSDGEPMSSIDGTWRKPYEILLLAKRIGRERSKASTVTRRVILGVPDLHSRKPCLKSMLESLLARECVGLEVFARCLMAGWWGWGNEVLKFQEESCWIVDTVEGIDNVGAEVKT